MCSFYTEQAYIVSLPAPNQLTVMRIAFTAKMDDSDSGVGVMPGVDSIVWQLGDRNWNWSWSQAIGLELESEPESSIFL